jgi:hypothetical protein
MGGLLKIEAGRSERGISFGGGGIDCVDGARVRVPGILGNEPDFVRRSFGGDDAIGILDEPNFGGLYEGVNRGQSDRRTGAGREFILSRLSCFTFIWLDGSLWLAVVQSEGPLHAIVHRNGRKRISGFGLSRALP